MVKAFVVLVDETAASDYRIYSYDKESLYVVRPFATKCCGKEEGMCHRVGVQATAC